jgi:hypothetical protein
MKFLGRTEFIRRISSDPTLSSVFAYIFELCGTIIYDLSVVSLEPFKGDYSLVLKQLMTYTSLTVPTINLGFQGNLALLDQVESRHREIGRMHRYATVMTYNGIN